jgi:hypothetical protein
LAAISAQIISGFQSQFGFDQTLLTQLANPFHVILWRLWQECPASV